MTDTVTEIDRAQIASDLRDALEGKLPQDVVDGMVAHFATAPKAEAAATTAYPANGSVASLILYAKCQCTVLNGGKTFNGSAYGISTPGGGALRGDVYTDNINGLYANTTDFVLLATPVYTSFIFQNATGQTLGSFQAGAISTVVTPVMTGSGDWS